MKRDLMQETEMVFLEENATGDPWDCNKINQEESFNLRNNMYAQTSKPSGETDEKIAKNKAIRAKGKHCVCKNVKIGGLN